MQVVQGDRSGHAAVNNPGHAKFIVSGSLAATEAADIAALVGATAAVADTGILAATESADNSALAGSISTGGTLSTIEAADSFAGTAVVVDVGSALGVLAASEAADFAEVMGAVAGEVAPPVSVGGGYWRWPQRRPVAVEGIGYAILPQLEGEAHGLVVAAGAGDVKSPVLAGTSVGTVAVVGRSAARLTVRVEAVGERGLAGEARAVLKGLSVAGAGAGGANCTGARAIIELQGAAIGRHDDDEAAIMAWLLAA